MSHFSRLNLNEITTHPTRKQVVVLTAIWLLAIGCLVISMTDLFTESFFKRQYLVIYILLLSGTLSMVRIINNYRKRTRGRGSN